MLALVVRTKEGRVWLLADIPGSGRFGPELAIRAENKTSASTQGEPESGVVIYRLAATFIEGADLVVQFLDGEGHGRVPLLGWDAEGLVAR